MIACSAPTSARAALRNVTAEAASGTLRATAIRSEDSAISRSLARLRDQLGRFDLAEHRVERQQEVVDLCAGDHKRREQPQRCVVGDVADEAAPQQTLDGVARRRPQLDADHEPEAPDLA